MQTMIVFCHLRWNFVFQRPQHLLSQFAKTCRVLVVEEPQYHDGKTVLKTYEAASNITICQPYTNVRAPGFHDDQLAKLEPLVANLVEPNEQPIVWFYTPMALPLLKQLNPSLVVYDCMDELSGFLNAPKQLIQREKALLSMADIVFTGGPSLYQSKRNLHANVHCFPSSVDAAHFGKALDRNVQDRNQQAELQKNIPRPRLGFYGVIDERLDTGLIKALAEAHADWQIVLVGPVVKIDPAALPRSANIHYLGQQDYAELPHFLAGWDVCLMPFALNEATRFISPTKVLEYMAAELPIVSTAITDVAVPYSDLVAIGNTHKEFIAACAAALEFSPDKKTQLIEKMRAVVAATSWEKTAAQMLKLMEPLAHKPKLAMAGTPSTSALERNINSLPSHPVRAVDNLVLGAGPTGLSAAYHLDKNTLLLERNNSVGGWCRSIKDAGFTFDYAGHIMFSNDPYVLKLYDILLGDNQHWQNREAWIYSKNTYTRYPFQGALYGLPVETIKECIMGAIEARYGSNDSSSAYDAGKVYDSAKACKLSPLEDCCADGTTEIANASFGSKGETQNFEDFIYRVWGKGIAKHFAIPYNKKLWTLPLSQMETSWLGGRVPLPDLSEIIDGALRPVAKPMGPNARFGYPRRGGFQALMSGFPPHIKGEIQLNADAVQLLPREKILVLADGRRYHYERLVSTIPLPELVRLMGADAPDSVRSAARGLRHISVRCVNIGIDRTNVTDKHWIYYPEDTIFHRIFLQGNASPECNAPGGFGFTCEISYSPWKPLPVNGDELIQRCIEDAIKVGLMNPEDKILCANTVDMPYAYVVYDHTRAQHVATIKNWMEKHNIHLAGRYSEWEYYNSDHAFLAGKKVAEKIGNNLKVATPIPG